MDNWTTSEQHDYVLVNGSELAGIVSLNFLRYLPRGDWADSSLVEFKRQGTPTADSDEPVEGHAAAHAGKLCFGLSRG